MGRGRGGAAVRVGRLPAPRDGERRGGVRNGGGGAVGGKPVGRHVRAALPRRVERPALPDQARPDARDPSGVGGRHARRAPDPPRDREAPHRTVPRLVERPGRDRVDQPHAGAPHGRRAPPGGSRAQGLRDGHGGGPLRAGHDGPLEDLHAHPRRAQPRGVRGILQEMEPHAAARLERGRGLDASATTARARAAGSARCSTRTTACAPRRR